MTSLNVMSLTQPSQGLGASNIKADQEEEISKSLFTSVKMGAVGREREIEKNDFQTRFEEPYCDEGKLLI